MIEWKTLPSEAVATVLASVGGLAKYLSGYMHGIPFSLAMLVANVIVSGFSGAMSAQFASSLGASEKMLYVCAGVGGFMGAATIEFIEVQIIQKFSIHVEKRSRGDERTRSDDK